MGYKIYVKNINHVRVWDALVSEESRGMFKLNDLLDRGSLMTCDQIRLKRSLEY